MFLNIVLAFLGTICISILFQVEKIELVFCGISGALGWTIYDILIYNNYKTFIATLYSAILITFLSRLFASLRKKPMTIFLTTGIITLVPGSKMYLMVFNIISHNNEEALFYGLETLKIAGAIALGILLILSLPSKLFHLKIIKKKN